MSRSKTRRTGDVALFCLELNGCAHDANQHMSDPMQACARELNCTRSHARHATSYWSLQAQGQPKKSQYAWRCFNILYSWNRTEGFFTIGAEQKDSLLVEPNRRILYCWRRAEEFILCTMYHIPYHIPYTMPYTTYHVPYTMLDTIYHVPYTMYHIPPRRSTTSSHHLAPHLVFALVLVVLS